MQMTKANAGRYAAQVTWAFIAATVGIIGGFVAGLYAPFILYHVQGIERTYFDSGLWMWSVFTAPIGAILGGLLMARMAMRPRG